MWQDEKLTRDVYLALFDHWGQWAFQNIAESEQRHMAAVKKLLDKYGIGGPAADDTPGTFPDPVK